MRQLVYIMFITNNHASFKIWQIIKKSQNIMSMIVASELLTSQIRENIYIFLIKAQHTRCLKKFHIEQQLKIAKRSMAKYIFFYLIIYLCFDKLTDYQGQILFRRHNYKLKNEVIKLIY